MVATTHAVRFDSVDAHRRDRLALDSVSFGIPSGAVASIVGPNGAGKSTMLGLISGRFRPTRGSVRVEGSVAEVLQATAIDDHMPLTVEDVVRQGRYSKLGPFRPMRKRDRMIVDEVIADVDMSEHRRAPITELSGGQRQRVLVAQGLAQDAEVLLLDEPMAGVDAPTQRKLTEVIRSVADTGVTVMLSTHSVDHARRGDMVIALCCQCLCCAPVDEALENPDVIDLFDVGDHGRGGRTER